MIIQAFLRWTEKASAGERAKAAGSLAEAYVGGRMNAEDRHAAEAAMSYLLDDPSPKVRLALACVLAASVCAPRAIVHALTRDQIEVASHVVALSPVLSDGDLVDLVADGSDDIQRVVAMRQPLSAAVCAAIAEVGQPLAVADMLENAHAHVAAFSIRRIAERLGADGDIRSRLFDRGDLPCDVRHRLVVGVSEALANFDLARSTVGAERLLRVTRDACQQATLHLAGSVDISEHPALVEHLRLDGRLTPALLMHTLCQGNIDFFACAIVSLSGHTPARVRSIVSDGRANAIRALYKAAGLGATATDIFVSATLLWRDALRRDAASTTGHVADRLIARYGGLAGADSASGREVAGLLMLVEKLNFAHRRRIARDEAVALAARAA